MTKKRYEFIDFLKALGVLIVINSHFDNLYPISALAVGGGIGNGLFFITSGFLCRCGNKESFSHWIGRKMIRLYLPTFIMTAISLFTTSRDLLTPSNAIFVFLWPTMFWFIGAIALFYALFYLLRNITSKKQFCVLFLLLAALYAFIYVSLDTSIWVVETVSVIDNNGLRDMPAFGIKLLYSFAMMMIGKYLRIYMEFVKYHPIRYLVIAFFGVICNYGTKFFMFYKSPSFMHLQFLPQLSIVVTVTAMMLWGISVASHGGFDRHEIILKCARWLSSLSLEFYVVQGIIITYAANFIFPLSILFACVVTALCAWLLSQLTSAIERFFLRKNGGSHAG